ncbi:MAG: sulfite exporter TauE/SafE family protein [Acidobacteriota bacterium]|nr:MAG: sulfite exporter TauE/SafE family protein [Acidobacteriota bacterium]
MSTQAIIILTAVFLITGAIGIVTGSNSLITVPLMFQFGIEPRVAVATNMFALVFMALGGTIPFLRNGDISRAKVTPLAAITFFASALGALIVSSIGDASIRVIVSAAMIAVAIFILVVGEPSDAAKGRFGPMRLPAVYLLTFGLGVYGGLFSGGYVTILTAVLVGIYGMKYSEAIASTKLINVVSSGVATAVFMWQGLVDYKLGLTLGAAMFIGGYAGATVVTKINDLWLKRIFLTAVFLLAAKTVYDLILI